MSYIFMKIHNWFCYVLIWSYLFKIWNLDVKLWLHNWKVLGPEIYRITPDSVWVGYIDQVLQTALGKGK